MRIRAKVGKNEIVFTSPLARAVFFQKQEGKDIFITIDDTPTSEMRRYFEGCLVPTVFYTHPSAGWKSFQDAREALKIEFLGASVNDLSGKSIRVAKSTTELSKTKFRGFIDQIVRWLLENELVGAEDIDPENYKAWRDSAVESGAEYPPIKRLKEQYESTKKKIAPPWRR